MHRIIYAKFCVCNYTVIIITFYAWNKFFQFTITLLLCEFMYTHAELMYTFTISLQLFASPIFSVLHLRIKQILENTIHALEIDEY